MDPKKEREWADRIPDPDEETDAGVPTYRDGSAQNECWAAEGFAGKRSPQPPQPEEEAYDP